MSKLSLGWVLLASSGGTKLNIRQMGGTLPQQRYIGLQMLVLGQRARVLGPNSLPVSALRTRALHAGPPCLKA